ncbi:hypothetical protein OH492_14655 [Vibrio chagasii]|nr:hypothetical protein [Vibrio chagasii]
MISKDGATIAFEVRRQLAGVPGVNKEANKAMAKTTSGLVFFTRYGSADETHTLSIKSARMGEISNTFLFQIQR